EGVGFFQRTIRNGFRYSSAKAFLRTAEKRKHVSVRTDAQVTNIIFEGKRAVGIRYIQGGPHGKVVEIHARHEVILSAGALNTPKLLQISG
ncbi:GMC family oxidoreductase N-terminal domain-containing protein, partial [Pseudomonas fluorescens]